MMTRAMIRKALVPHLGAVLTPEVAAAIEAALAPAGRPVDVDRFEPLTWGDFTIKPERMADVLDELHPLHVQHWGETEKHRHGLLLNPDYDAMLADEASGGLLQFVVRKAGAAVGHLRLYLRTSRHTQTVFAQEDTLFISPEHRGGMVPLALLRYAERCVQELGAREVRADSKLVNRADVLMRRLGYTPVATMFHKFLKGE